MRPLLPAALVTALLALLPPAPARADALLARPAGASGLLEARAALARGPSRSTAWYQLRVDPGADELLWVLPVPAGAAVDLSSSSFLDALEQSTAPRVLPPPGPAPKGQSCTRPAVQVVSGGDAPAAGALAGQDVFTDVQALVAKVTERGYDGKALDAAALGSVVTAGGRLLALRLSPPASALEAEATVTVRVNGPGVGLEALPLLAGGPSGASLTLWLLGGGRGRVGGAAEIGIDPTTLRWTGVDATNYASRRDALLAPGAGASLVLEMAGPRPLHETVSLPGGSLIPPLVDSYLRRVFERGEASGDLGVFSGKAEEAVAGAIGEACPRGDLIAPEGACQPGAGPAAEVLIPAAMADDLAFAYAGDASGRWVTRLAGLWPAQKSPPALTADFVDDESVSLLYTPASDWDDLCQSNTTQGGGGQGGVGGSPGGRGGQGSGNRSGSTSNSGPDYVDDGSTVEDAATGVSCAAAFGNAMCSTANTGSDSESCDCNGSGGGDGGGEDGDDSSCSSGESGGSDGCGCGDSGSGDDGSGESCSGAGGDSSNSSCSGSDTSSGSGDGCGKCSTGRGRRSPPRLSKWLIVMTALALPLRRRTRPRREAVLPGSRDFRPIGVS